MSDTTAAAKREAQDRAASQVHCTNHASYHELCGACFAAHRAADRIKANEPLGASVTITTDEYVALVSALARASGVLEALNNLKKPEDRLDVVRAAIDRARAALHLPPDPQAPAVPAPHDVDECEDRACAVCSEYHGGRDDGGTTQDEDSRFAPLIDPEKERAKLAQRTQP